MSYRIKQSGSLVVLLVRSASERNKMRAPTLSERPDEIFIQRGGQTNMAKWIRLLPIPSVAANLTPASCAPAPLQRDAATLNEARWSQMVDRLARSAAACQTSMMAGASRVHPRPSRDKIRLAAAVLPKGAWRNCLGN